MQSTAPKCILRDDLIKSKSPHGGGVSPREWKGVLGTGCDAFLIIFKENEGRKRVLFFQLGILFILI